MPGRMWPRFYRRWKSAKRRIWNQYGGMKAEEAKRLKELEEENQRLKEIVAELTLDNRMLKHVAEKNW
jgi:cell shape-determining protein MreC